MPHYVYLARCSDNSLYAGTCIDLKAREAKHNEGEGAKYTRSRLPVMFVYSEEFRSLGEARSREAAIKRLPRQGKLQLIHDSVPSSLMTMKKSRAKAAQDITLRDVVVHMQHMEQRLISRMDNIGQGLSSRIDQNTSGIAQNTAAVQKLEQRIDALDEDLTATIKDTYNIRTHIGMAIAHDE